MRAAVVQLASGSVLKANLAEAERQIRGAVEAGADLVVLPENFGMITAREDEILAYGETDGNGPLQDFLSNLAASLKVNLIGGTIPFKATAGERVTNSLLVFDRNGERLARYDKIHLFDVSLPERDEIYRESNTIEAGSDVVVVEIEGIKLGLSICYDLRFPELFRRLVEKGAEVIVLPAAFTATTGKAHWHTLLRARAIENLCYVLASNQGGYHVNGRETYGHSLILDPWGNSLVELANGNGYGLAEINPELPRDFRSQFPVLAHRRITCS